MARPASSPTIIISACNVAVLRGSLRRQPEWRELPSGSELVSFDVRVERPDGPAETVPVELLEPPKAVHKLALGDEVIVVGRVQRRFFRSGGVTQSRTAVAAACVLRPTQRRAVERALQGAVDSVWSAETVSRSS